MSAWIKTAAEETPGVASSQRLAFLIITAGNVAAFLLLVACVAFGKKLSDIPNGIYLVMGSLQLVATGGKVMQQRSE
jgi:hypothetical protein